IKKFTGDEPEERSLAGLVSLVFRNASEEPPGIGALLRMVDPTIRDSVYRAFCKVMELALADVSSQKVIQIVKEIEDEEGQLLILRQ
ncbi:MAG: hypothetical protein QMD10_10900, partial [Desulfitobacteriaceae bacterium]|nr:hypothetical protein [Desulfitobacteriaceae bacterium]